MAVIADGAITIQFDNNMLLITSVMSKEADAGKDFMPLMIEWRESYAAAGKIGG